MLSVSSDPGKPQTTGVSPFLSLLAAHEPCQAVSGTWNLEPGTWNPEGQVGCGFPQALFPRVPDVLPGGSSLCREKAVVRDGVLDGAAAFPGF